MKAQLSFELELLQSNSKFDLFYFLDGVNHLLLDEVVELLQRGLQTGLLVLELRKRRINFILILSQSQLLSLILVLLPRHDVLDTADLLLFPYFFLLSLSLLSPLK